MPTTYPDLVDKLKLFITQGKIIAKFDGTFIDTGLSPITIYLPDLLKMDIVNQSEAANMTAQEWILHKIFADCSPDSARTVYDELKNMDRSEENER